MRNREVSVSLTARVDGFIAGMRRARAETVDFAKTAKTSVNDNAADWDRIGNASLVAGAAIGAGVVVAARAYMEFEAAMSKVGAVADANASQMKQLSDAAITAGQDTVFSASQAAEAEAELAKAGVSVTDILEGGLSGALNLAAAGQIDLGKSAEIAAQAMNIFKLEGSDVGHIADVLTAGANKSAAGVDDLGQALTQGGMVAASMGMSLEETVASLSMFADAGMKGSDAGTSLKTAMQRLAAPSGEAETLMRELGVSAFDSQGKFVGLATIAEQLRGSLGGMSEGQRSAALATIFGADAVRAATVWYQQGAAGVDTYTKAVDDNGAAQRMAARQMDNLKGDLEQLRGSLETAFIKGGSGANDGLRSLAQNATAVVNAFSSLNPETQAFIVKAAAVSAGALIAAGGIVKVTTTVHELRAAWAATSLAGGRFGAALGSIGSKATKVAGVLTAVGVASQFGGSGEWHVVGLANDLAKAQDPLRAINDEIARTSVVAGGSDYSMRSLGDAFNQALDPGWWGQVQAPVANVLRTFGGNWSTDAEKAAEQVDGVGQSLARLVEIGQADKAAAIFSQIADAQVKQGRSTDDLMRMMPAYQAALDQASVSAQGAAGPTSEFAGGIDDAGGSAAGAASKISDLASQIEGFGSVALGQRDAARAFQGAIDDAAKAVEQHGRNMNINTQAGRENQAALDGIASAGLKYVASTLEVTGSTDQAAAAMGRVKASFIKTAGEAGITGSKAEDLARKLGLVPENVKTQVSAPGATQAKGQIDAHTRSANGVPRRKVTQVEAPGARMSKNDIESYIRTTARVPGRKTTTLDVNGAGTAIAQVQALINTVARLNSKSVTLTTRYVVVGRPVGRSTAGGSTADAYGSIHEPIGRSVRRYATGDIRNGHVAQIARAGDWRVWAEDETAGEAYIPFRSDTRPRSIAIWQETGRRLGVSAAQAIMGAARFDTGGTTGRQVDTQSILSIFRGRVDSAGNLEQARRSYEDAARALREAKTAQEKARARYDLAEAKKAYDISRWSAGEISGQTTLTRVTRAAGTANATTKAFLDNIDRLSRMGYGTLAMDLLEMGEVDGGTLAAQAVRSGAGAKALQSQFAVSAGLAQRREAMRANAVASSSFNAYAGYVRQAAPASVDRSVNVTAYGPSAAEVLRVARVQQQRADALNPTW